jgi:2-polyprenyl-3-methyl-5-hydroxy-6-metoxy-1,4-benzoquinol methylase
VTTPPALPLTGERTAPGHEAENYWFRRHEAAYAWVVATQPVAGAVAVEAGCGEGYGAALLTAGGAAVVVAMDLDHPTLVHVAHRYAEVAAVRANLVALPVATAAVDLVVSSQVVEHLWDQDAFVADCARVLRPGGSLVVTTPNRRTFPPGNAFHHRELDAGELVALVGRHLEVTALLGVHHGDRLTADEAAHGDLVATQVAAGDRPGAALLARVAGVTVADFVVDEQDVDHCLDLVLTAVRR